MTESLLEEARRNLKLRADGVPARGQEAWVRVLGACVEQDNGCWMYQRHCNRSGYGFVYYKGRMVNAHRVIWLSLNGPIADGLVVCHTCDNPPCCNPSHLWLGTKAENNRDREVKGRSARNLLPGWGSRNGRLKLVDRCRRGHRVSPETIAPRSGRQTCRICEHRSRDLRAGYVEVTPDELEARAFAAGAAITVHPITGWMRLTTADGKFAAASEVVAA